MAFDSTQIGDDFNPRTHEECDGSTLNPACSVSISIHALTRSATRCWCVCINSVGISIHALTRSATVPLGELYEDLEISIHALTRSATSNDPAFKVEVLDISIHALTRSATGL